MGTSLSSRVNAEPNLADWLREEPFTLCMSSGFFGFFAHAGMLRALEERGLTPARVAGSSSGALVGTMWASGQDSAQICSELLATERYHFWDPAPGLGLLRGDRFRRRLAVITSTDRLEACRVPVAISVFDIGARKTAVLRHGDLITAVTASCSFPGLFHPVRHDGRLYSDGGILDRHGLTGVVAGERTLHHLLVSRSPWRRKSSPGLQPAQRRGLITLLLPELPRSGPFRLERGVRAMKEAHRRTLQALERPISAVVRG